VGNTPSTIVAMAVSIVVAVVPAIVISS